jgi:CheY-like chemotaxis protein
VARILLVDDDPKVLRLLEATLRLKEHDVIKRESGAAALAWLERAAPDLIISDIMMPDLDGFDFLRRVREGQTAAAVPFIFLSARSEPEDVVKGLRLGADEFLRKPFSIDELLIRVERVLSRGDAATTSPHGDSIEGQLAHTPLHDVLRMLHVQRRTGVLSVDLDGLTEAGAFQVRGGQLVHARLGHLRGPAALFQAMAWEQGTFRFRPAKHVDGRTVRHPTLPLLMEGFRLLETGRVKRIDPGDEKAAWAFVAHVEDARLDGPKLPFIDDEPPAPAPLLLTARPGDLEATQLLSRPPAGVQLDVVSDTEPGAHNPGRSSLPGEWSAASLIAEALSGDLPPAVLDSVDDPAWLAEEEDDDEGLDSVEFAAVLASGEMDRIESELGGAEQREAETQVPTYASLRRAAEQRLLARASSPARLVEEERPSQPRMPPALAKPPKKDPLSDTLVSEDEHEGRSDPFEQALSAARQRGRWSSGVARAPTLGDDLGDAYDDVVSVSRVLAQSGAQAGPTEDGLAPSRDDTELDAVEAGPADLDDTSSPDATGDGSRHLDADADLLASLADEDALDLGASDLTMFTRPVAEYAAPGTLILELGEEEGDGSLLELPGEDELTDDEDPDAGLILDESSLQDEVDEPAGRIWITQQIDAVALVEDLDSAGIEDPSLLQDRNDRMMAIYEQLKIAGSRILGTREIQLSMRSGVVIASAIPDGGRREAVANFARNAIVFATTDAESGLQYATLDAGALHVVVLAVDELRLLALLFDEKPQVELVLDVVRPVLAGELARNL